MEDKRNLITILISQHRALQEDLKAAAGEINGGKAADKILADLMKFKADLVKHLELENGVFYVELLAEMKKKGQDITKTEQFIDEMKAIGDTVMKFLESYDSEAKISQGMENFQTELPQIIDALNLRIESEESGVYAYWGLF